MRPYTYKTTVQDATGLRDPEFRPHDKPETVHVRADGVMYVDRVGRRYQVLPASSDAWGGDRWYQESVLRYKDLDGTPIVRTGRPYAVHVGAPDPDGMRWPGLDYDAAAAPAVLRRYYREGYDAGFRCERVTHVHVGLYGSISYDYEHAQPGYAGCSCRTYENPGRTRGGWAYALGLLSTGTPEAPVALTVHDPGAADAWNVALDHARAHGWTGAYRVAVTQTTRRIRLIREGRYSRMRFLAYGYLKHARVLRPAPGIPVPKAQAAAAVRHAMGWAQTAAECNLDPFSGTDAEAAQAWASRVRDTRTPGMRARCAARAVAGTGGAA